MYFNKILFKNIYFIKGGFFPFREELNNILHKFFLKYPRGGNNIFFINTLVYQLLYFKNGDKKSALNMYRDINKISSAFFKFDSTQEQQEYLDIISLGTDSINILNLPKNLREYVKKYEIDDSIYETAENLFNFVKQEVNKLKNSEKDFFNTFINDFELYRKYFDYVYRFGQMSNFE